MKKVICFLVVLALAGDSGSSIASAKRTIARLLNGIQGYAEAKYGDDFVKQIEKIIANKKSYGDYYDALRAGNLQEIVWLSRENGDIYAADEMERLLTSALLEEKIVAKVRASSGITDPWILTFDNGMRGVFKHHQNWQGIAMYRLDKLLGTDVFPITVMREVEFDGERLGKGSIQLFVENSISLEQASQVPLLSALLPHSHRINTLAWLANDIDMGDHNVLIPMLGRQFAIDGGRAFYIHIGRWLLKESSSNVLKNTLNKYHTHPDFIKHLQSINDEDLRYVAEPLFNFFSEDEIKILKNFEEAIASTSSKTGLTMALAELRKICQTKSACKGEADELVEKRIRKYRALLAVPDFLRKSIDDYIETEQETQHPIQESL